MNNTMNILAWFSQNKATIIVLVIVAALFAAALSKIIKDKKSGKSSCSCGCKECQYSASCHSNKNK